MKLIALTGGIASGKSTIGRRLAELGAVHIDADQLARDAVAVGSPGLAQIRARFGDGVIQADGALDRPALGARVFGRPDELAALNAIVHPEVRRLFAARCGQARAADPAVVVVYEIPLFVETLEAAAADPGGAPEWDRVVVADAPAAHRAIRLQELRGHSEAEALSRIASQASDEERRAVADVLIDTSGSEAETIRQVDALWASLQAATA